MGFFSKPKDVEVETTAVPAEEHVEEIPSLPTPLTSTVIATGLTVSAPWRARASSRWRAWSRDRLSSTAR